MSYTNETKKEIIEELKRQIRNLPHDKEEDDWDIRDMPSFEWGFISGLSKDESNHRLKKLCYEVLERGGNLLLLQSSPLVKIFSNSIILS